MSYLTRHEPTNFLAHVNKILENAFRSGDQADSSTVETSQWYPSVDIKEDKDKFCILTDLPGVDKKDVSISMENNILTIKGTRAENKQEPTEHYYRVERIRGGFHRRFSLPDTADGTKIEAKLKNGVLEINIPKKETAHPRSIEIHCDE